MPPKKRPRPSTGQMLLTKMLGRKEETDGSSVDLVQTAGTSVDPPVASTSTSTVSSASVSSASLSSATDGFGLSAVDEEKKESTTRKFVESWLRSFQWLEYDKDSGMMFCSTCKKAKKKNSLTTGCNNYRKSTLTDHEVTQDHRVALQVPSLQEDRQAVEIRQLTKQEKGATKAIRTVHWMVTECIPLSKHKSMMNFLRDVEVPDIEQLSLSDSTTYESSTSTLEFLQSMSAVIEEKVETDMAQSEIITVLVDESTDRSNKKRFAILVKAVDSSMQPITHYLTNIQVEDGTGETMARRVKEELAARGVKDLSKVYGLGTDGATAMTGLNKGLTGMMRRENPAIVNVHCIAHRLALCTSQAADEIPALKDYVETLTSLFYYFSSSPARSAHLEEIQEILQSDKIHFREVHQVRWLSFYEALEAVHRNLVPLLTYLENSEAGSRSKDPKAIGLKRKIATVKFLGLTYIMMDVIPIISILNLFFQASEIDVAMIKVKVDDCLASLEAQKFGGKHFRKLQEELEDEPGTGKAKYHGHDVSRCPQEDILSAAAKFVDNLKSNIMRRFPDSELLTAFGVLSLRPISFIPDEELEEWGTEQFEVLLNHYGQTKTHEWKEDGELMKKEVPALVDSSAAKAEFTALKKTVKRHSYARHRMVDLYKQIAMFHGNDFPNVMRLAKCALTLPVHTADVERTFSAQNLVCTPLRNRITPQHQDMLLRVYLEGPKREQLSQWVMDVLDKWASMRKRMLLKRK